MSSPKTSHRAYLLFAAGVIVVAVVILQSFLVGLLCGGVMAVSVWPLYERSSRSHYLRGWSNGPRAALFSVLLALVFISPITYGIYELAVVYSAGSNYLSQNSVQGVVAVPSFVAHLPFSDRLSAFWLDYIGNSSGLIDVLNKISNGRLLNFVPMLWSQAMEKTLTLLVMLMSLYFMLKHGARVKSSYAAVLDYWVGARSVPYVNSAIAALRGTINGVVLVGVVEGVLLAIPLMAGGVTSGLLIGLSAGVLGVIPLLMPLLILPCLFYLYLAGETLWALIGTVDLIVVWFVFENIVKPQVIGKRVRIHTLLILMALIGGLQIMGLVGLFLGPAFVAVGLGMLQDLVRVGLAGAGQQGKSDPNP